MELCSMLCCSLDVLWVQNGFMYVCDLVPLLFTGNYPNIVNSLYPNTKFKFYIYICLIFKPQYLRMFSYLEIGYLQSNQIKTSSLVWILILYCLCLHKKGKFHTDLTEMDKEKSIWRHQEISVYKPRDAWGHQNLGKISWADFIPQPSLRRNQLCQHPNFSLLASRILK